MADYLKQFIQDSDFGIKAVSLDFDKLLNVRTPEQLRDEIPTLNRMGYMKVDMDEFCQGFIEYATQTKGLCCMNRIFDISPLSPKSGFMQYAQKLVCQSQAFCLKVCT